MLELRDVTVKYGHFVAVSDFSLTIQAGEIVALLGGSGCGKSSLLRAIAGLEPLSGGDILWNGESLTSVPVHKRGVGMMFQDAQLFQHYDVAGNVAYGIANGSAKIKDKVARGRRVTELLELVGLAGFEHRKISELSGGQQQRVALARSLAPQPRVLLLDEPLSALDRSLRERLSVELRESLKATNTTGVYVTHDQAEAFVIADRVAVLANGKLLQIGTPTELRDQPVSAEVAAFLGLAWQ